MGKGGGVPADGESNVANTASAKKRNKQNERNRTLNRARKSALKTTTRKFLDAIRAGELQQAQDVFVKVQKELDQVGAKGTLHRNTVARRKSRLAKRLSAALAEAKSG